jgi:hypothetical protein
VREEGLEVSKLVMLESSLLCEIGRQNAQLDGSRQTKYSCSHHKLMPECVVPPARPRISKMCPSYRGDVSYLF